MNPSRRSAWLLLIIAASGLVAYWSTFAALAGTSFGPERFFSAATIFSFSVPEGADGIGVPLAQIAALVFGFTAVLGVALELSPSVRSALRRLHFRLRRGILRRRPAVVIGLGWVGGALAEEIRQSGRPVYALALDKRGPRAEAAVRVGVLVEEGDATTDEALERVPLAAAEEVFIATGEDMRNLEIAGSILRSTSGRGRRVYVHIGDPSIGVTAVKREVLPREAGGTEYYLFSVHDNAASLVAADLHRQASWADDEALHVVLVGFGMLGQTLALRLARSLHGPNHRRLRLTVLCSPSERSAVARFRALHPGFAPAPGFSLRDWNPARDAWDVTAGTDPAAESWRTAALHPRAVEVAVLAEFVETATPVSPETTALLLDRFTAREGVRVRPAIVVATDQEKLNARYAVGLQDALLVARQWPPVPPRRQDESPDLAHTPVPTDGIAPVVPLHPYLFDETGLHALMEEMQRLDLASGVPRDVKGWEKQQRARSHPLRPFGFRTATASYGVVTRTREREDAKRLHEMYRLLAGQPDEPIPSAFEISNLDAVALAYRVFERYFVASPYRLTPDEAEAAGVQFDPVLAPSLPDELLDESVRPFWLLARLFSWSPDNPSRKEAQWFQEEWAMDLHPTIRPRLGESEERRKLREDAIGDLQKWIKECADHDRRRQIMLDEYRSDTPVERSIHTDKFLEGFKQKIGQDLADRLAETEHNRWMAERLALGWRYGQRSDSGRRRETFLVWDDLTEEQRVYDRAHLPRLILESQAAFGSCKPGTFYYLRTMPQPSLDDPPASGVTA
ncbi:MAG: NAD-binding protein [Bacteroidota bacterium]